LKFTRVRGFQDSFGDDALIVRNVEEYARLWAERYALKEIKIPIVESVDLYRRTTGETSDIVEKQMFTFGDVDEKGATFALRPEGTPGVVRAYMESGLHKRDPEQRFFYSGEMFRRERPQKGRYRQFSQFGVEIFGRRDAACDAELLILLDDLRKDLGLTLRTEINSLGDSACRPAYRTAVLEFGRAHSNELCQDCRQRLERNPLRLLDCKIDAKLMEAAPESLKYLCDDCKEHFDTVQELIVAAGIEFSVNPRLVRGLDYYTRTAFEVLSDDVGSQNAVAAGGRYDGLVEALGGPPIPGIGFAIGLERMALAIRSAAQKKSQESDLAFELFFRKFVGTPPIIAIAPVGSSVLVDANKIAHMLRKGSPQSWKPKERYQVLLLSAERSLNSQLRQAGAIGAQFLVIFGDREQSEGIVQLRELNPAVADDSPKQRRVPIPSLVEEIKNLL
jgi:histidyl-tRNA synthetase